MLVCLCLACLFHRLHRSEGMAEFVCVRVFVCVYCYFIGCTEAKVWLNSCVCVYVCVHVCAVQAYMYADVFVYAFKLYKCAYTCDDCIHVLSVIYAVVCCMNFRTTHRCVFSAGRYMCI